MSSGTEWPIDCPLIGPVAAQELGQPRRAICLSVAEAVKQTKPAEKRRT